MAKAIYLGDNTSRKVKKIYEGNGVARKIKKGYVGDSTGKARLFFTNGYMWERYNVNIVYYWNKYNVITEYEEIITTGGSGTLILDFYDDPCRILKGVTFDKSTGTWDVTYYSGADWGGLNPGNRLTVERFSTYNPCPIYRVSNVQAHYPEFNDITIDYSSVTYYSKRENYTKGNTSYGEVTSSNSSSYPDNDKSGNYWYIKLSKTDKTKGSYIDIIEADNENTYPDNGVSGNYWYVKIQE